MLIIYVEYEPKLDEFTEMELEVNGVKKHTAKGYAIKDTAVWWLFEKYGQTLEEKGYTWEEYLEVSYKDFSFFIQIYSLVH